MSCAQCVDDLDVARRSAGAVPMSRATSLISRSRSLATSVAAARSAGVAVASSAVAAASVSGIANMPRASCRTTASDSATSICVTGCVDGSAEAGLTPGTVVDRQALHLRPELAVRP